MCYLLQVAMSPFFLLIRFIFRRLTKSYKPRLTITILRRQMIPADLLHQPANQVLTLATWTRKPQSPQPQTKLPCGSNPPRAPPDPRLVKLHRRTTCVKRRLRTFPGDP